MAVHSHKYDIRAGWLVELLVNVTSVSSRFALAPFRPRAAPGHAHLRRGEIASLRAILPRSSSHEIVEYDAIGRVAQPFEQFRRAKSSSDAGQRVQLDTLICF